jgi:hypothetical protein
VTSRLLTSSGTSPVNQPTLRLSGDGEGRGSVFFVAGGQNRRQLEQLRDMPGRFPSSKYLRRIYRRDIRADGLRVEFHVLVIRKRGAAWRTV